MPSSWGNNGERFQHGQRVFVVDLKSGAVHKGFVQEDSPPLKLRVRYDTGQEVFVGREFVRRDDGR